MTSKTQDTAPQKLAAPLPLPCGVSLRNRLGKSAMTEALADRLDRPTVAHQRLYQRWSEGGLGVQVTGNVMVDARYLERPGNVVAEDETVLPALTAWARAGKAGGAALWMQISHPGRQCPIVVTTQPLSPSREKLKILGLFGTPREMSVPDIEDAIARYATTADLAKRAGFDGVQIHGAHGYLISQFLSPSVNRRSDAWGGALENRARFLRRVYAAVRAAVGPDFPVAVKLNSADFQKGGFSLEDCAQVAQWLEVDGIDLIELSGGTYEQMSFVTGDDGAPRESTRRREAYFLEYAREVRNAVKVPIMVTGGFRSRDAMERALVEDGIDMIGLARPLCVYPDAASRLLNGTLDTMAMDEGGLTMGRGAWGVNTKNWLVNLVNTVSRVEFFGDQMRRMSQGKDPVSGMKASAVGTFLRYLTLTTVLGVRRRFVRRS